MSQVYAQYSTEQEKRNEETRIELEKRADLTRQGPLNKYIDAFCMREVVNGFTKEGREGLLGIIGGQVANHLAAIGRSMVHTYNGAPLRDEDVNESKYKFPKAYQFVVEAAGMINGAQAALDEQTRKTGKAGAINYNAILAQLKEKYGEVEPVGS